MIPHQRSFRGLVIGPGTPYVVTVEEGLESVSVRSGTRDAPRAAGSIPGLHVADSKRIVLRGWINAPTVLESESLWAALKVVMGPSEDEQFQYLFQHEDGVDRFVWARLIDRPSERNTDTEAVGFREFAVGFEVADPRIYSVEQHSELVPILSVGFPGFDLAVVNLPINMGAGTQENAVVVNAGDQDAYPICRFQYLAGGAGVFAGIVLTNETNGSVLTITAVVTAGQILVADMDAYVRAVPDNLIVYIDTASRFGDWEHPRDPFFLSPGSNTLTFEVTGVGPTDDAVCSVTWRDTSL